ncbi:MAG: M48 family metalloprotease [Saprospirales bacterium]|nr:M48 family metalloprotease [Saprospirales bacterium]
MNNASFFLPETLVHALGWTLVHSLWQGAAGALVLWMILPRLRGSNQRYWASYAALTAVFLAAFGTFVWKFSMHPAMPPTGPDTGASSLASSSAAAEPGLAAPAAFWPALAEGLEPYHPLIVSIWLLGLLVFLVQLAGGLHYIYRLRSRQNAPAPAFWRRRLQDLASRTGLSRPVALLESALVHAPMALGLFKPLILLPVGLINQLTPAEAEAILAHELAHIARRDWLFNLLQTLIETVFYFHPGVWWISAAIRLERENCCDDAAVALSGNRLTYAKALVHVQGLARPARQPALALGLEGAPTLLRRRPQLLERINRILHQPQPSSTIMEKTIALAILAALITLWTVRANTPPALAEAIREMAATPVAWFAAGPQDSQAWQAAADTLTKPQKRQRIVREDDDQRVELEMENGRIRRLLIDGKEIAASDYDRYRDLTDDIRRDATPPPAPPAPPGFGWETAPAPPGAPETWDTPPPPAPFPSRAASARLHTENDADGNTIIRLERNGKPVEIRVKAGEVWVDGQKVEDGQTLDLPGENSFLYWHDGNQMLRFDPNRLQFFHPDGQMLEVPAPPAPPMPDGYHFEGYHFDGNQFHFEGLEGGLQGKYRPEITEEEMRRAHDAALRELEQQRKEIEKALREQERTWKKDRKAWSKQQREQRRALEEAQREMQQRQWQQIEQEMAAEMAQARTLQQAGPNNTPPNRPAPRSKTPSWLIN